MTDHMPRMIRLALCGCVLTMTACAPGSGSQHAEIDELFADISRDGPGCSVAVQRDGVLLHEGGYGSANLDHDIAIEPDTVFHVASVSKQFAAAAIVLLALEGELSLDDDIRQYVPELHDFGRRITLSQLIHHTSGLRDQWVLLGMSGWRYSEDLISNEDVMDVLTRQRDLNFEPGSDYTYSNSGYTLLAITVERVSGQSFREFTREQIFEPLGMDRTFFRDDFGDVVPDQAYAYVRENGDYKLSVTNFDTVGATSLLTTAGDLMKWQRNWVEPEVGGEAFVSQMLERGRLVDGTEIDYAHGVTHGDYRGVRAVSHAGGDAGYGSFLARYPDHDLDIAVLCNGGANPIQKTNAIAGLLLEEHVETVETPSSDETLLDGDVLAKYEGSYWHSASMRMRKFVQNEGRLELDTGATFPLTAKDELTFTTPFGAELTFAPDGSAVSTVNATTGRTDVFQKLEAWSPDRDELLTYAGTYQAPELTVPYTVALKEDGSLTLSWLKNRDVAMRPAARDIFVGQVATLQFVREPLTGAMLGFTISNDRVRRIRFLKQP